MREVNEDRFHCDPAAGVYLVVDGIGGYRAGEVAADLARELIVRRLQHKTGTLGERIREAVAAANNAIVERAEADASLAGMACVLTVAVVENGWLTVGHVGDTRLYIVQQGRLHKVTCDHSPVGMREDLGELSEAEAMAHPLRNEIWRDVGSAQRAPCDDGFVDLHRLPFDPGLRLLLCTDGLTDLVPQHDLEALLAAHAADPGAAVDALIDAALAAGGDDNVTAVVVDHGPAAAPTPVDPLMDAPEGESAGTERGGRTGLVILLLLAAVMALGWYHGVASQPPSLRPSQPPPPQSFHVDPANPAAFTSIAAALDRTQPGDTVWIHPGRYPELVRLRDRVHLSAVVPGAAVLAPHAPGAAVVTAEGVRGALVEGLTIEAAPEQGAGLEFRSADVTLRDVEIVGAGRAGIRMQGGGRLVAEGVTVCAQGAVGIDVRRATGRVVLIDALVCANGAATGGRGLLIGEAVEVDIRRSRIVAQDVGVQIDGPAAGRLAALRDGLRFYDVRQPYRFMPDSTRATREKE